MRLKMRAESGRRLRQESIRRGAVAVSAVALAWLSVPAQAMAETPSFMDVLASAWLPRDPFTVVRDIIGLALTTFICVRLCRWLSRKRATIEGRRSDTFDEKYFRDVPSDDSPAALQVLVTHARPNANGLVSAIMTLVDKGVVGLEQISPAKGDGPRDQRLTYLGDDGLGWKGLDRVDRATLRFLFGGGDRPPRVGAAVLVSRINDAARLDPHVYLRSFVIWSDEVLGACRDRGFFDPEAGRGLSMTALLMWFAFAAIVFPVDVLVLRLLHVSSLAGVASIVIILASSMVVMRVGTGPKAMSAEAGELRGKTLALGRWLADFTQLEEDKPSDVALWGKLMAFAVMLGVADKVMDEVPITVPDARRNGIQDIVWNAPFMHPNSAFVARCVGAIVSEGGRSAYPGAWNE